MSNSTNSGSSLSEDDLKRGWSAMYESELTYSEFVEEIQRKAKIAELEKLDELEIFPYDCLELEKYVEYRIAELKDK